jgi:pimeloyl-ACP methyl ester carboxylesterase
VVLVRHSYGGTVITVAGVDDNVKAPVYGRLRAGRGGEPGGAAGPVPRLRPGFSDLASALVTTSFPVEGGEPGTDVSVDVAKFPAIFAADVEQDLAEVLAVSQRPLAAAAFAEPASAAAWKTRPSWGSVSSADHTINPDLERFGDQRAGATTVEIDSSHLVMLSHPKEVADLVREALCSVTA